MNRIDNNGDGLLDNIVQTGRTQKILINRLAVVMLDHETMQFQRTVLYISLSNALSAVEYRAAWLASFQVCKFCCETTWFIVLLF